MIEQRCCRTYDVAKGGNSTDDCCVEVNSRLDHGWRVVCVTPKADYTEYIIEKEVDDSRRG